MRSRCVPSLVVLFVVVTTSGCRDGLGRSANASEAVQTSAQPAVALPNKDGSFKFAVLGDFGTGDDSQYELASQMAQLHARFKYQTVVLVGDNLYGSERPQD